MNKWNEIPVFLVISNNHYFLFNWIFYKHATSLYVYKFFIYFLGQP